MNIITREITEADFTDILMMIKEFAACQGLQDKVTVTLDRMQQDKDFFDGFIVKDEKGRPLAYCIYCFFYSTFSGKTLYMDDLYVREDCRNKGVGSDLIRKVIDVARNTKCVKMRWQVGKWNTNAIKFYESIGAEIDHVEMTCTLMMK